VRRSSPVWLAVAVLVAACNGGDGTASTIALDNGAATPTGAVEQLHDLLSAGDFDTAGSLAVPGQAALASLAEGATSGDVAAALRADDSAIAANFWGGFAQGAGEALIGEVVIEDRGSATEEGVEFHLVGLTPESGTEQLLVTREVDGQRIDLFASFGAGLAGRLTSPVETLLSSPTPDAEAVLAALQEVVPSLLLASRDESLTPEASQDVLQLIELITRVG
jgi:hypothetical protein